MYRMCFQHNFGYAHCRVHEEMAMVEGSITMEIELFENKSSYKNKPPKGIYQTTREIVKQ